MTDDPIGDAQAALREVLEEVEQDDLLQQDDAHVDVNAPLAIQQIGLKGQARGLRQAINIVESYRPVESYE